MRLNYRLLKFLRAPCLIVSGCLLITGEFALGSSCELDTNNPKQCFLNKPVATEPSPDGQMRVVKPLVFIDDSGKEWSAPTSTLTDGASIPGMFIPVIGERTNSQYFEAAVIHDAYCARSNADLPQYQSETWEDVHRMFYQAMISNGTPRLKAKIMYAAVYLGGPRWNDIKRSLSNTFDEVLIQELKWCIRWIETKDPSPERIAEWMQGREPGLQANQMNEPNWDVLLK